MNQTKGFQLRKSKRFVLVTGGAGYIGSHACVELINAGFNVVVVDNFVNSSRKAIARIEELCDSKVFLFEGDIRDAQCLSGIFDKFPIYAVMHFAGLKAVNDSVHDPLHYYENNVVGTLTLLKILRKYGCKRFIFSFHFF